MSILKIWDLDKIRTHKDTVGRINGKRFKPTRKNNRRVRMKSTKQAYSPSMTLNQMVAQVQLPQSSEQPFEDHLEHLQAIEQEATFILLAHAAQRHTGITDPPSSQDADSNNPLREVSADQLSRDYTLCSQRNRKREVASKLAGVKLTFVELCQNYSLDEKERVFVQFLLLQATSPKFRKLLLECGVDDLHYQQADGLSVGFMLELVCDNYRDQLEAHRYFSVDGTLVREDLIEFDSRATDGANILTTRVRLQDGCVRYCLGDRNLYNETFKHIRRETGRIHLEQVILPDETKQDVVDRIASFYRHRSSVHASRMDEFYGYGTGLALLFHGPSGTGKTMLAQALSNHFQKQLFYMTEQSLQDMPGGYDDIFQTIFREANLHNGIVFFDEADDLFQEGSMMSRELLIALEKSHCVTVLATNKPVEMDPAMERRLSMKIAFNKPDAGMREVIWKALVPDFVALDESVDFKELAEEFQFSGGLIKNTVVMAIANALRDDEKTPLLSQSHLQAAAILQLQQVMENDPLFSTVNEHIALDDLSLSSKNQQEFKGLEKVCLKAVRERLPLRFALQDKSGLGRDVAIALANKCDLKARVVNLSVLMRKQISGNKVMDPFTQKEVEPLDVVFSKHCTEDALLIFNDPMLIASNIFSKQSDGKSFLEPELVHRLKTFKGCCCFITEDDVSNIGSRVFDFSISLDHPEVTYQLALWQQYLPDNVSDENQLLAMIEKYPMQKHDIENVVRRAQYLSLLESQQEHIKWAHLNKALEHYAHPHQLPVLFGGHHE